MQKDGIVDNAILDNENYIKNETLTETLLLEAEVTEKDWCKEKCL